MQRQIESYSILLLGLVAITAFTTQTAYADKSEPPEAFTTETVAQELSCFLRGATPEEAGARPSPLRQVRFSVGGGEALLCYSAPSAKGREIMGGLVPYGSPWRSGANEPTTIHLAAAATIGGVELEAGSYSIYSIPGEDEWEFFLNSNYERWGIPISGDVRATEVGSFTVTPEATDGMVEMLTYDYSDGAIIAEWENTRLRIPVG